MYKFSTRDFDANLQDQIVLPGGNYKGIGLSFEGVNLAAQQLLITDLGFLKLYNPSGGKVWDFSIDRMYGLTLRKVFGNFRFSSALAGAIGAFIYIPFGWNDDKNIVRLGSGWVLEWQHTDISTITTSLNLTIMLQRGLGVQRYFPVYQDFNIRTLSAETTPEEFPRKNLAYISVVPDTDITVLKLEKDSNLIYDMTDEQADFVLNAESVQDTFSAGIAGSLPWVLDLYKERNLTEVLGSDYKFGVVNGTDPTVAGMTVEFQITEAALDTTAQVMATVKDKNAETPAEKSVA